VVGANGEPDALQLARTLTSTGLIVLQHPEMGAMETRFYGLGPSS
jgi:hypothetical protein